MCGGLCVYVCVDVVFKTYCLVSLVMWCHLHAFANHSESTSIFNKEFSTYLFNFIKFACECWTLLVWFPFGSVSVFTKKLCNSSYFKYWFWRRGDLQCIFFSWESFPVFIVHWLLYCTVTCSFSSWHCWHFVSFLVPVIWVYTCSTVTVLYFPTYFLLSGLWICKRKQGVSYILICFR